MLPDTQQAKSNQRNFKGENFEILNKEVLLFTQLTAAAAGYQHLVVVVQQQGRLGLVLCPLLGALLVGASAVHPVVVLHPSLEVSRV